MIEKFLNYGKANGCSDIHLSTGSFPMLRIDGNIIKIPNSKLLSKEEVSSMLDSIMTDKQKNIFETELELDFSIEVNKLRFRVNAFYNRKGKAAAFREIPLYIQTLAELEAPNVIKELVKHRQGLILLVGPTGSGKSTTIAAMIDHISKNQASHIITIEDPIEFIQQSEKSLINQREVGQDTRSFANALKGSLREDPDVIFVGEMRDRKTTQLALTAAETGHLVFATLHTNSASQSINRMIDIFPSQDKGVARSMISSSILAVISQRLIKKKEGKGRCAAYEIMIANSSIRNLIREDKIPQINSAIQLGKKEGMCLLTDSIKGLLAQDIISKETAEDSLLSYE